MNPQWLNWLDVPARFPAHDGNRLLEFAERIAARALEVENPSDGVRNTVAEIAAELGAPQVAVVERTPEWRFWAQQGRWQPDDIPWPFVLEALDREAAGLRAWTQGAATGQFAAAPLRSQRSPTAMLLLAGRSLPDDVLAGLSLIARAVGLAWDIAQLQSSQRQRIARLKGVLSIAAAIASFPEVEPLLERIAGEATRLLDCDRASIFLWDQSQKELVARPALGVEGGSLRIPDRVGVVGEVLATGQPIRVDDAYADKRFSQVVDRASGYVTRNLMCVPLNGAEREKLGVFEVINKRGGTFTDDDLETVQELSVQIAAVVQNTRERELLLRSHQQLTEQVTKGSTIIGDSPAISAVRSTVGRLAGTDLPVLILGESGTGKEVVASALHYQGPRSARPFIAVNCAALAETLLESELFGHEKGSFTDAHELRRGKFELAEGGTIFLDEIGDMSLGGQAKLLRVLEQKVITRVGGSQAIPINVRVVAATNARLAEAVRNRKFREDLYYRLNVVSVDLPPLRDRADDVLPLAEHFLKLFAAQARRPRLHLSAEAKKRMQAHHWPGNVRELRNLMERVAFLAAADKIEATDLAFILSPEKQSFLEPMDDQGLSEATNSFQQVYIRRAIQRVRGNMSEAAKLLGLHRSNLYRKMRQLNMSEAGNEGDEIPAD
ncbi:MAG: sigma-54-dependent Fis family transcriptional regulator [Planctomycetaceae bacterium]|nr:sigma-54-dependent Fis family transcriptional regulator [Planctomycetaceae bacterium]